MERGGGETVPSESTIDRSKVEFDNDTSVCIGDSEAERYKVLAPPTLKERRLTSPLAPGNRVTKEERMIKHRRIPSATPVRLLLEVLFVFKRVTGGAEQFQCR